MQPAGLAWKGRRDYTMAHIMNDELARDTAQKYVCSACYGHLLMFFEPGRMTRVECHRCGAETPGFVTARYANQRRSDSIGEAMEVKQMLRQIGMIVEGQTSGKRTAQQVLDDLGF
jgi:hypothetical protein